MTAVVGTAADGRRSAPCGEKQLMKEQTQGYDTCISQLKLRKHVSIYHIALHPADS